MRRHLEGELVDQPLAPRGARELDPLREDLGDIDEIEATDAASTKDAPSRPRDPALNLINGG